MDNSVVELDSTIAPFDSMSRLNSLTPPKLDRFVDFSPTHIIAVTYTPANGSQLIRFTGTSSEYHFDANPGPDVCVTS